MGATPPSPLSPSPLSPPAGLQHISSLAQSNRDHAPSPSAPTAARTSHHITSHLRTSPPRRRRLAARPNRRGGVPPMTRSRSAWIAVVVCGVMSGRGGQRAADARPRAGQGQGRRVRAPGTPEVARDQAARREGERRRRVEERSEGREGRRGAKGEGRKGAKGEERSDDRAVQGGERTARVASGGRDE